MSDGSNVLKAITYTSFTELSSTIFRPAWCSRALKPLDPVHHVRPAHIHVHAENADDLVH
jgi:hypothetical protein